MVDIQRARNISRLVNIQRARNISRLVNIQRARNISGWLIYRELEISQDWLIYRELEISQGWLIYRKLETSQGPLKQVSVLISTRLSNSKNALTFEQRVVVDGDSLGLLIYLRFEKCLLRINALLIKSRLHCIDIITDHRTKQVRNVSNLTLITYALFL